MHKLKLIIEICIVFFLSCTKSIKDKNIEYVKGYVNKVESAHIGKGKVKRIAHYEYYYNDTIYRKSITTYFKWQGVYNKGDSIGIKVCKDDPNLSSVQGKIKKQQTIVYKLKSKTE